MRKFYSLFLFFLFLFLNFTLPVVYSEEVIVNKDFELLKIVGIYDSEVDLSSKVTRGNLAKYIADLINIPATENESLFEDVSGANAGYINSVCSLGIMSGFSKVEFGANEFVTFEQLMKVMVNCLGYNLQAESKGGYPSGYILKARELGLLKYENERSDYVTYFQLFEILEASLELKINIPVTYGESISYKVVDGNTLLSVYRNIYKKEAIVDANNITGIRGNPATVENQVLLNGTVYYDSEGYATALLGYKADVYYMEIENIRHILYAKKHRQVSEKSYNATEIEDYSNYVYTLKNKKQIKINQSVNVIYNGKILYGYTDGIMLPKKGNIILIDNDNDNSYGSNDVIMVNSIVDIVVEYADPVNYKIYDKYDSANNLYIDMSDENVFCEIKDKHGDVFGVRELREWDVLSAIVSLDKKYIKITLVDEYTTGVLEEIGNMNINNNIVNDDSYVTINGTKYPVASAGIFKDIKLNDKVTIFWNMDNKIVAVKNANDSKDGTFAVLTDCEKIQSAFDETVAVKLYNGNRDFVIHNLGEKVKFNGDSKKSLDIYNTLNSAIGSLMVYKTDSEGNVSEIITPEDVGVDSGRGLYKLNYPEQSLQFGVDMQNFGLTFYYKGNVFVVPKNVSDYDDKAKFSSVYNFENDQKYVVEGFTKDKDSLYADIVIVRDDTTSSGTVNYKSGFLIEEVYKTINDDGEQVTGFSGYQGGIFKKMKTVPEDDLLFSSESLSYKLSDITPGDIIRYHANTMGYIDVISMAYDFDKKISNYVGPQQGNTFFGSVYDKKSDIIRLSTKTNLSEIDLTKQSDFDTLQAYLLRPSCTITVVEGNKTGTITARNGSIDDIASYSLTKSESDTSFVVILAYWKTPYEVIVYNLD